MFLKKIGQKRGFRKKNCAPFFLGSFGFTSLLLHDVTRCFRRVCKKPIKIGFSVGTPCCKQIFEKQKKKVAKLLTYGGQVIDPTAYIYI